MRTLDSKRDFPSSSDSNAWLELNREQAIRLLPALVTRMGLEIYDRDVVPDLPFTLWEAIEGSAAPAREFPIAEVALFRLLARVADGWVRHDDDEGLVFVRRGKWLRSYAAWKKDRAASRGFSRTIAALD